MLWIDKVCIEHARTFIGHSCGRTSLRCSIAKQETNGLPSAVQHRPKALNKLIVHQDIGEHLIKLVNRLQGSYV